MELITSTRISELCNYNFGDQASYVHNLFDKFMIPANNTNIEFLNFCEKNKHKTITLFIDNIRLYNRELIINNINDKIWVDELMNNNDLLKLCSELKDNNFIIFTGHEDTYIDETIINKIPDNVLNIYAINVKCQHNKIISIPYGLQRKLQPNDNRIDIIKSFINKNIEPNKLLYINHSNNVNKEERIGIYDLFQTNNWCTVENNRITYDNFLNEIKNHKFVICPIGNAIDCHRNIETLYMRRVPVMKKNIFLEKIYKDLPILFVDNYKDINEELLKRYDYLYNDVLNLDFNKLDLKKYKILFEN